MTTSPEFEQEVENLVRKLSPSARKKYELLKQEARMADVFMAVESFKKRVEVQAWGLADTTMEDVFVKVAKGAQLSQELSQPAKGCAEPNRDDKSGPLSLKPGPSGLHAGARPHRERVHELRFSAVVVRPAELTPSQKISQSRQPQAAGPLRLSPVSPLRAREARLLTQLPPPPRPRLLSSRFLRRGRPLQPPSRGGAPPLPPPPPPPPAAARSEIRSALLVHPIGTPAAPPCPSLSPDPICEIQVLNLADADFQIALLLVAERAFPLGFGPRSGKSVSMLLEPFTAPAEPWMACPRW
ncbi:hypothetical protein HU200_063085 [Digitaria exilis]|uniref:Uncharacterized protein n=1 Tax=Digitaria exilis TaxID=1010633 RepID=A0A835A616_9POAL|nr:hypothetical protein HU200_063085 [Digitaria exilis]